MPSRNQSEYYLKNKEHIRKQQAEYRVANKEKCTSLVKAWQEKNKDKVRQVYKKWQSSLHGRAVKAAYKRRVREQKPLWASDEKIVAIYEEAFRLGLTVDHIIPLHGKLVSGLHVENNLQLLSRSQNSSKFNRFGELN